MREITAPPGYAPMEDMEIEILPDQPQQTFTILNQPIQVEIEKTSGDTGKLLGGAVLQLVRNKAVSYTHLDVYKRQGWIP